MQAELTSTLMKAHCHPAELRNRDPWGDRWVGWFGCWAMWGKMEVFIEQRVAPSPKIDGAVPEISSGSPWVERTWHLKSMSLDSDSA